jgi:hypothetical protein
MDRVNEIIYSAGLPGVPRMIPWVKFRALPGVPDLTGREKEIKTLRNAHVSKSEEGCA